MLALIFSLSAHITSYNQSICHESYTPNVNDPHSDQGVSMAYMKASYLTPAPFILPMFKENLHEYLLILFTLYRLPPQIAKIWYVVPN